MNMTVSLTVRNLKLYFRDKVAVFFSILAVIVIIALYALYLGNIQTQALQAAAGRAVPEAAWLVHAWVFAGILAVGTVTVSLGAYGTMVDDVQNGRIKDFFVTPIRRAQLVTGYMVSSALITTIMSIITFILAEVYIVISGGSLLQPIQMMETLGILALSIFSYSSLVCFIASFLKSMSAFSAVSTIVGTMIGFVTGIYVPVGMLPDALVTVMKFTPFTYSVVWLRQMFTKAPMAQVFANAPQGGGKHFADLYGINIYFGNIAVKPWMMALIMIATGIVFFILSIWRLSRRTWITK
jgi:multidrug/hemolysin transport system permease protein